MGVYSTVVAELECERCRSKYRADAQFYTDDDRDMPEYTAGQVVPALKPDSIYEGMADAFCADCMKQWVADEKGANFEALAAAIEAGDIAAMFATYRADPGRPDLGRQLNLLRQDPLTSSEVRSLGAAPERFGWPNFAARLSDACVMLFRNASPLDDSPGTWWSEHAERVRKHLSAKGWRAPADNQFRDVMVRVEKDGRIDVTAQP